MLPSSFLDALSPNIAAARQLFAFVQPQARRTTMGLVEYSDSESSDVEVEAAPAKASAPAATTSHPSQKRPFQKVVDRSNPGKIVLSLPQPNADGGGTGSSVEQPPAKRARTGAGGGLFSGFNSLLPAPKNANKAVSAPAAAKGRPGINLKTSAAPGFNREAVDATDGVSQDADHSSPGLNLPPPAKEAGPSISDALKPADKVKLVGKPLMFKPLSVSRNSGKKKATKSNVAPPTVEVLAGQGNHQLQDSSRTAPNKDGTVSGNPPKKAALFPIHTEESSASIDPSSRGGVYEPLFQVEDPVYSNDEYAEYARLAQAGPVPTTGPQSDSLDKVADELNLSAAERRELFGRGGANHTAKRVINFNMDTEYRHNEDVRASGEQQVHNPVRAIQSGKHSLKQLVQNVHNQREALEDSFAKGKTNRKEASSKYGW
ncbi:hypothetical protein S40288_09444 [Stachybotrys chartarum IBT 40288]|nr:hypothetical protein S40288_09444 [Stachybotrys chartarum IBT 40288]